MQADNLSTDAPVWELSSDEFIHGRMRGEFAWCGLDGASRPGGVGEMLWWAWCASASSEKWLPGGEELAAFPGSPGDLILGPYISVRRLTTRQRPSSSRAADFGSEP